MPCTLCGAADHERAACPWDGRAMSDSGPTRKMTSGEGPESPSYELVWREAFNTRSAWGRHPSAYWRAMPQHERHDDDMGPWGQRRLEREHPGDE